MRMGWDRTKEDRIGYDQKWIGFDMINEDRM